MSKSKLLEILKENRAAHRAIFEEALKGYKQQNIDLLELHLANLRAGKVATIYISLPIPEDHTKDYDRVIRALELDNRKEVELSEADVQRYVMDDWTWKRDFLASNRAYSISASKAFEELS